MSDLDFAEQLLAVGVPVVVCTPNPAWSPGSKVADVLPPVGWSTITAAECDLSGYRPGVDTLAMAGGHGVDVVDVDTKDDGSVEHLPSFRSFGHVRTPSGGSHYYVVSTGIKKISPLTTNAGHVGDYVGGTVDGGGRLLAFLPGSTRPKYGAAGYEVVVPLDLAALVEHDPDDDLIGALLACGGSRDGLPGKPAARWGEVRTFLAQHSEVRGECRYGRAVLAGLLTDSQATVPGDPTRGRHGWAVRSATRIVELVRAGCASSADVDTLEATLARVKPEGGTDWGGVLAWALANADGATGCGLHNHERHRGNGVARSHQGAQLRAAVAGSATAQRVRQFEDHHEEDLHDRHDHDRGDLDDLRDDLREGMHSGQLRMSYRLANSTHRDRLLHVYGVGWHHWDGRRWAYDDQGHAVRAVRDVLRKALAASVDFDTDHAKAIRRDVDKCSSATGTAGVLVLAASMAPFTATVRDLDTDPYLLNVANGTLDLRTDQLRGHDPGDRITKVTTAAYQQDADATTWETFLERVLPDQEVRAFLQRLAGVALLGRVVEHVLGILTGVGANGKGVFTRAVEHALGDYAASPEADLFMLRDGAHPTGQYDLLGVRWATVSETDQGRRLAEATMKRLTGGDPIRARRMRQDFIEFQPSHTAVLVTNHLPSVRGDDPAIWRRIRVVPFDVVIPEAERDKHLDERLQLQADAVLSWAVAGYRDYSARGDLGDPQAVTDATSAYQLDSDPVARFIDEECIVNQHGHTPSGELYTRWLKWAAAEGAELSQKAFGLALERKGYASDQLGGGRRIRRGLLLTDGGEET